MNSPTFRSGSLYALTFALFLCASTAQAVPVAMIGGASDPDTSGGFDPLPPSPPVAFGNADVTAVSDGNAATGFQFTLRNGEFTSNPLSTVGFQLRFDFDVSNFESIDGIDFSWTGRYELGAPIFNESAELWLSAGNGVGIRSFDNGNDLGTDLLHTYTASWEQLDNGINDVDRLLHDGLASIYVQTGGIGFTLGNPVLPFHTLDTREVLANVRGTLRGGGGTGPVGVPEPGTLSMFAAAAFGMFMIRRRRTPKN